MQHVTPISLMHSTSSASQQVANSGTHMMRNQCEFHTTGLLKGPL